MHVLFLSYYVGTFLPPGQPDPVRNCSIETLHNLNIKIQCISGTSGGLEQQFLLKVLFRPFINQK